MELSKGPPSDARVYVCCLELVPVFVTMDTNRSTHFAVPLFSHIPMSVAKKELPLRFLLGIRSYKALGT